MPPISRLIPLVLTAILLSREVVGEQALSPEPSPLVHDKATPATEDWVSERQIVPRLGDYVIVAIAVSQTDLDAVYVVLRSTRGVAGAAGRMLDAAERDEGVPYGQVAKLNLTEDGGMQWQHALPRVDRDVSDMSVAVSPRGDVLYVVGTVDDGGDQPFYVQALSTETGVVQSWFTSSFPGSQVISAVVATSDGVVGCGRASVEVTEQEGEKVVKWTSLVAYIGKTGHLKWAHKGETDAAECTAVTAKDEMIYTTSAAVATEEHATAAVVRALTMSTGTSTWARQVRCTTDTGLSSAGIAAGGEAVFVTAVLHARNGARTMLHKVSRGGTLLWSREVSRGKSDASLEVVATLFADDDRVYTMTTCAQDNSTTANAAVMQVTHTTMYGEDVTRWRSPAAAGKRVGGTWSSPPRAVIASSKQLCIQTLHARAVPPRKLSRGRTVSAVISAADSALAAIADHVGEAVQGHGTYGRLHERAVVRAHGRRAEHDRVERLFAASAEAPHRSPIELALGVVVRLVPGSVVVEVGTGLQVTGGEMARDAKEAPRAAAGGAGGMIAGIVLGAFVCGVVGLALIVRLKR